MVRTPMRPSPAMLMIAPGPTTSNCGLAPSLACAGETTAGVNDDEDVAEVELVEMVYTLNVPSAVRQHTSRVGAPGSAGASTSEYAMSGMRTTMMDEAAVTWCPEDAAPVAESALGVDRLSLTGSRATLITYMTLVLASACASPDMADCCCCC
ncbi:hypothetical protein BCR44DRAFT_1436776 [Catenaria anguillulae PL171]|uniref:Uncharacterized protein n=1 Tax=Catenaria anguillulae PL171 TaxID=765915 RepID=A0A1Y2HK25_9FUNG|nr:hypothetical protein BCR44DRAFT_1436776 [Catenaria anguillulae PL171]